MNNPKIEEKPKNDPKAEAPTKLGEALLVWLEEREQAERDRKDKKAKGWWK